MSATARLSPRAAVGLGLIVSAMGVLVMLLAAAMIPGGDASLEAPRWVVACAGLMFVLLGAALIVGYAVAGGAGPDGDLPAGTPRWARVTQALLGVGIVGSLTAVASWIAFGPGPRAFTVTLPPHRAGPGKRDRRARRLRDRRGADGDLPGRARAGQRPAHPPQQVRPRGFDRALGLSRASTFPRPR